MFMCTRLECTLNCGTIMMVYNGVIQMFGVCFQSLFSDLWDLSNLESERKLVSFSYG